MRPADHPWFIPAIAGWVATVFLIAAVVQKVVGGASGGVTFFVLTFVGPFIFRRVFGSRRNG